MSSFVDAVPLNETFIARYNLLYYNGDIGANQLLPIAGLQTAGAEATSWGHGLTLLWRPPIELGERWSYALSATVPFVSLDVTANVTAGATTVRRTSSVDGLGDIVLMPLMLNYNISSNPNVNFWTFEPTLVLMYFGVNNGREASIYVGTDFNTENPDTQYQSGTQFYLDGTLAQHFPLLGGLAGVGVNGFWYDQITPDSGSGATFGGFEGRTTGVGPVISYMFKIGKVEIIAEAKWLHEVETTKRLEGNIFWLKLVAQF
jgi:hypothetical protein